MSVDTVCNIPATALTLGAVMAHGAPGITLYKADLQQGSKQIQVAVKQLKTAGAPSTAEADFLKEVQVLQLASATCQRVCRMLGCCKLDGGLCIVMSLYTTSAAKRLEEVKGPLSLSEAVSIATEVLEGLSELHAENILHLDMKPGNILMDKHGHAYLSDFGISYALRTLETCTTLTTTTGTPHYMAPEQVDAEFGTRGTHSDVWGFAAAMLHLATGQQPYHDLTMLQMVSAMHKKRPPAISDRLPTWLQQLLKACFSFDQATRPSVSHLLQEMHKCTKRCWELCGNLSAVDDDCNLGPMGSIGRGTSQSSTTNQDLHQTRMTTLSLVGGMYTGQSENNQPHGQGKMTHSDGSVYNGAWKAGKKQGQGTSTWRNGDKFVGSYHDDKKQGQGKMTYSDGRVYDGEWERDKWHGLGSLIEPHGSTHVGSWCVNELNGKGKMTNSKGEVYDGDWERNQRHGQGMMTYSDGKEYDGAWKHNNWHGEGSLIEPDGSRRVGSWCVNEFHGKGKMMYPHGGAYDGDWEHNKRTGQGKMTYSDGSVYDGEWKFDKRHGLGTCTWLNGKKESGPWYLDKYKGRGAVWLG